jgi:hypothetical protein
VKILAMQNVPNVHLLCFIVVNFPHHQRNNFTQQSNVLLRRKIDSKTCNVYFQQEMIRAETDLAGAERKASRSRLPWAQKQLQRVSNPDLHHRVTLRRTN